MARAKKKTPPPVANKWSGSVHAHMTSAMLREYRMDALMGTSIDPDRFIEVVEVLESAFETATMIKDVDLNLFVTALAEMIKELGEVVEKMESDCVERFEESDEDLKIAVRECGEAVKEHDKEVDELSNKLASLADDLTLTNTRLAEAHEAMATKDEHIEKLEAMLAAMRSEKPLKTRKARS